MASAMNTSLNRLNAVINAFLTAAIVAAILIAASSMTLSPKQGDIETASVTPRSVKM